MWTTRRGLTRCRNCDLEFGWRPVLAEDGHPYCCEGCADGGPCACLYDDVWPAAA